MSAKTELDALRDAVDSAEGALRDAYRPESTREELAEAVGQALDILEVEEEDDEDADDEEEASLK